VKKGVIAAIVFGIAGVAVATALGVWQVQRLSWKQALIAQLEERLAATPVALPSEPDPVRDEFLRVRVTGRIGTATLRVLSSVRPYGPGYRIIAPLTVASGQVILVDLGFVPGEAKDIDALPADLVEVVGALYWPNETDGFTPEPDREANIWFARDLDLMAAALATEPVMIVAETYGGGEWPKPQRLGIDLANDHLQYALTWFSLALIWGVMGIMLVARERKRLAQS